MPRMSSSGLPALNLSGPFSSTGYGVVATHFLHQLVRAGVAVAAFPIGGQEVEERHGDSLRQSLSNAAFYDRKAPSLRIFHQWLLAQHVGKGPHVGFPIFELDRFNAAELHHLRSQDALLVASDWAKDVVEANGIVTPTRVVPFGVDLEVFGPRPMPQTTTTTFLHCAKAELRKGLFDVVECFGRAFELTDDVRLILHCHNPFMPQARAADYDREWRDFVRNSRLAEKILITPGRFQTQREVADLMAQTDCGLFPSRAEGWNLELMEMLAMGRPCIATDYSGHTGFCRVPGCRLIQIDALESAYDGVYFHGQGSWARFGPEQQDQLIEHMRSVHAQKSMDVLLPLDAAAEAMREFSWVNVTGKLIRALTEVA